LKKVIVFILIAALSVSCFAACKKNEANKEDDLKGVELARREPEGWNPDNILKTEEYIFGVENVFVEENGDGKYKITFRLSTFCNYSVHDVDIEAQNEYFITPTVSLNKDFTDTLEEKTWITVGNYYHDPVYADCEYLSDVRSEKLYIKMPVMYIAPRKEALEIDSRSISDYDCKVDVLPLETGGKYPAIPVSFSFELPGKLKYMWYVSSLEIGGETIEGSFNKDGDSVKYNFYLPEGVSIDNGYTLVLKSPKKPLERAIMEITI